MHVGLRWVPDNLRARVTSLIFMCASLGTVVGMAATPALASCIGWQVRGHPPTVLVTENTMLRLEYTHMSHRYVSSVARV